MGGPYDVCVRIKELSAGYFVRHELILDNAAACEPGKPKPSECCGFVPTMVLFFRDHLDPDRSR